MRLQIKSSVSFTLMFFIIGVMLSWFYVIPLGYDILEADTSLKFSRTVELRANSVGDFLDDRKDELISFSRDDVFRDFLENPEKREELLDSVNDRVLEAKENIEFFDEVFVLSPEGDILINTQTGYTPQDIFREFDYSLEKEGSAYVKPLRFCYCVEKYVLDITTPIYSDSTNDLVGLVVERTYVENLRDIAWGDYGLEDLEKVYLVDSQGLLVSSSEFSRESADKFTQNVDNENARKCFSMDTNGKHIGHDAFTGPFLNYLGDEVVGTHRYLSDPDWCVLVEADVDVLNEPKRKVLGKNIFMSVIFVLALSLIGYSVGGYFDKRRGRKSGKR